MPTPIKADVTFLQERLQAIISRAIRAVESDQKKNKGVLGPEGRRQIKALSEVLNDQIKLQRQLELDRESILEGLPEHILEAIAEARKTHTRSAKKAPVATAQHAKGGSDARKKPGPEVGDEAKARGSGAD